MVSGKVKVEGIRRSLQTVRLDEVERNNAAHPDHDHDDSNAVQVLFHHSGTGQVRLHATTEQAGQTATLALVQENSDRHEQTRDDKDDLKCQGHGRIIPLLAARLGENNATTPAYASHHYTLQPICPYNRHAAVLTSFQASLSMAVVNLRDIEWRDHHRGEPR